MIPAALLAMPWDLLFRDPMPDERMWFVRESFRFGPRELGWLLLTLAIVYATTRPKKRPSHLQRRSEGGGGAPPPGGEAPP